MLYYIQLSLSVYVSVNVCCIIYIHLHYIIQHGQPCCVKKKNETCCVLRGAQSAGSEDVLAYIEKDKKDKLDMIQNSAFSSPRNTLPVLDPKVCVYVCVCVCVCVSGSLSPSPSLSLSLPLSPSLTYTHWREEGKVLAQDVQYGISSRRAVRGVCVYALD